VALPAAIWRRPPLRGTALHDTRPSLPPEGEWTLAGLCDQLFEVCARCARERRPMHGGGMGELGVGRGQIELLAALFYADAPNDVAPSAYNEHDPGPPPRSPPTPRPNATGFRWAA
jgi:hypothetical protein